MPNSLLTLPLAYWSVRQLIPDETDRNTTSEEPGFQWPKQSLLGIGLIAFCCMLGEGAMADWTTNYLRSNIKRLKTLRREEVTHG